MKEGINEVETSNNWGNSATHTEYNTIYYNKKGQTKAIVGLTPQETYGFLIDKLLGHGTWESNPWVFAYEFELVK